ncbi:hypothetical protein M3Y97_00276700 [Aphelenchoides bicaudatus]|nr:hypothetical protein M3Y97_00276700 [Aphelenchoides bicaudatus]
MDESLKPSTSNSDEINSIVSTKSKSSKQVQLSSENRTVNVVKKPRIVLDEDVFTDNLEKIIVRDFFPEVPRLKAQREYLDAVADNDVEKIRELQLQYSSNSTNGSGTKSIRRFKLNGGRFDVDTDMEEIVVNPEGLNEEEDLNTSGVDIAKHSVQTFVDTYISEDNNWIYEAEAKHNKELIERGKPMIMDADKQLMLRNVPDDNRPLNIDNWAYKARNNVLFGPEGAAPTLREFTDAVKNQSSKIINKSATRIDTATLPWRDRPTPSNQFVSSKVDITGKTVDPHSNLQDRFKPVETPNPTIGPGESPLITWGQIDGTPFRLDSSDMTPLPDHAPVFKLPEMTKRELIAHEMVDKLKRQNREKKLFSKKMTDKLKDPHTRLSASSRMSMMSPAAAKFANTKLGIKTKNTGTASTSKKTPMSVHLPAFSMRSSSRSSRLQTPTTSSPAEQSTVRLEPMDNVFSENLLSVRKQKHQFQ